MVTKKLTEITESPPEKIDENTIQFTKTEKWETTKTTLLDEKLQVEKELADKQKQLDEINQLLQMLGEYNQSDLSFIDSGTVFKAGNGPSD